MLLICWHRENKEIYFCYSNKSDFEIYNKNYHMVLGCNVNEVLTPSAGEWPKVPELRAT